MVPIRGAPPSGIQSKQAEIPPEVFQPFLEKQVWTAEFLTSDRGCKGPKTVMQYLNQLSSLNQKKDPGLSESRHLESPSEIQNLESHLGVSGACSSADRVG